jgi:hypothetical protein
MPSIKHTHPNFWLILWLDAACAFVAGAGLAFGPREWRGDPSYDIVDGVVPIKVHGLLFMAIGLSVFVAMYLGLFRVLRLAQLGAVLLGSYWIVALLLAARDHKLYGALGVPLLIFYTGSNIAQMAEPLRNPLTEQ